MRNIGSKLWPAPPALIGTPPSARPLWHDPAAHARDFAHRYAQDLDLAVAERMRELKIREEHRNGMDHEAALKHAPKTELPIGDRAREICKAMEKGWKGRSR